MSAQIPHNWLQGLSLDQRMPPDLITKVNQVEPGPYADSIRTCIAEIGLSAIFCIDKSPAVAFLVLDEGAGSVDKLNRVYSALWNQGLASLLAVIQGETIRLYSLNTRPKQHTDEQSMEDDRLLDVLTLADKALEVGSLISGLESGRLTKQYPDAFDDKGRVDAVLLTNLHAARKRMVRQNICAEQAAKLLMQAMFLAYLRDREIIDASYFLEASGNYHLSNLESFFHDNIDAYKLLLKRLKKDFNGGMFSSVEGETWTIAKGAISDFLRGDMDMETGQLYLFPYNFKYIPVELISEVYDVFLGTNPQEKKASGSFYTPRFLAKLAIDQVWSYIESDVDLENLSLTIDPACGSGIFLVALFHRYVELYRYQSKKKMLNWDKLSRIAQTLHGIDTNPSAVLIAAFSLSIALLEQVSPPQIQGKKLPRLLGVTIRKGNFFDLSVRRKYSAVIGNPPWGKASDEENKGEVWWKEKFGFPCPNREMAWPFIMKAMNHLRSNGIVGFLLPVSGVFFNTRASQAVPLWIKNSSIKRLLNLADMRFLLFRDANQSSMVAIYSAGKGDREYPIQIWSPKSDINLVSSRRILLTSQDKTTVSSLNLSMAPVETIKRAMWSGNRANKLAEYFETLPKLTDFVTPYKQAAAKKREQDWILGQGFQPLSEGAGEKYKPKTLEEIGKYPFIETDEIDFLGISKIPFTPEHKYPTKEVLFEAFKEGFSGPRILIREGAGLRFRAAYTEQGLVYKNAVKVLGVPDSQKNEGKLLTAILCSSVSSWILLQNSQVWISRPRFQQGDLFGLPFPQPEDLPEPCKAQKAKAAIIRFMDGLVDRKAPYEGLDLPMKPIPYQRNNAEILSKIDELVFDYFGLLPNERSIISETMDHVIKTVQPSRKKLLAQLTFSYSSDWQRYCSVLERELAVWMTTSRTEPKVDVVDHSKDLVVIRISLNHDIENSYRPLTNLRDILGSVYQKLPVGQTRNIYLLRNLMVFIDTDLYLLRPRQSRFWLSEVAMDDADTIASEMMSFDSAAKDTH